MPYCHTIPNIEGQLILINQLVGHGKIKSSRDPLKEKIKQAGRYIYSIYHSEPTLFRSFMFDLNISALSYDNESKYFEISMLSPEIKKFVFFQLPYCPEGQPYNYLFNPKEQNQQLIHENRSLVSIALSRLGKMVGIKNIANAAKEISSRRRRST